MGATNEDKQYLVVCTDEESDDLDVVEIVSASSPSEAAEIAFGNDPWNYIAVYCPGQYIGKKPTGSSIDFGRYDDCPEIEVVRWLS